MSSMIVVYSAFGGFPASSFDNNVFWYPIHRTVEFVPHLICLLFEMLAY